MDDPPRASRQPARGRRAGAAPALALLAAVSLALPACDRAAPDRAGRREPPPPRELVVLTRNAPTTWYVDRSGRPAGFEHDLASAFARDLGLTLRFEVLDSVSEIIDGLAEGRGDLAAAGLSRTPLRDRRFPAGPSYQTIEELVVCNRSAGVDRPADLAGQRIAVVASSSYEEKLERLGREIPEVEFETVQAGSSERLMKQVWQGRFDCTVADSHVVAIERRFLPELETPFALGGEQELVWYFSRRGERLLEAATAWLEEFRASGELAALRSRYYGHVGDFDYYDTAVFHRRIDTRLPRFRPLFEQAEERSGISWTLLAAISYQESHWDPGAVSPTGVKGLMMLTLDTARAVGVEDRTDPRESIVGGAVYLRELIQRIPGYVPEPDRRWMALAAYNVGLEHLRDARKLAIDLDRNPNSWPDLKWVLPLLAEPRHYRHLRHGYARGHEPVVYVENIRNYRELLLERLAPAGEGGESVVAAVGSG